MAYDKGGDFREKIDFTQVLFAHMMQTSHESKEVELFMTNVQHFEDLMIAYLDNKYKREAEGFETQAKKDVKEWQSKYSTYFKDDAKVRYVRALHQIKYRALVKLMKRKGLIPSETASIDM